MKRIYIPEGKQVGTIYHFTKIAFNNPANIISPITDMITNGLITPYGNDYISFTRNFNLQDGNVAWGNVRFVVDGNKLSTKYKVEPFLDIGLSRIISGEQEERILWPSKSYLPIDLFIIEINFIYPPELNNQDSLEKAIIELRETFPSIPFRVVGEYMPYKRQIYNEKNK